MIDPDYQGEVGLLLYSGGKEEYMWNTGNPLGHLTLYYHALWLKSIESYKRTTNGPDPSEMSVCITRPVKEPQPPEMLTEGKAKGIWNE